MRTAGKSRTDFLITTALVLFSIFSLKRGFSAGLISGSDIPLHWNWTKLAIENLRHFQIHGWQPFQWNGMPLFYFYAPLPHYIVAAISQLLFFVPFNLVFNSAVIFTHALLPITIFVYARREFDQTAAIAAALFSFVVQNQTGGIGMTISLGLWPNAFALTIFPIALWAASRFVQQTNQKTFVAFVMITALALISHILLVSYLPWILALYLVGSRFERGKEARMGWFAVAFIASLLLSIFWWGPAFAKSSYSGGYQIGWTNSLSNALLQIARGQWTFRVLLLWFIPGVYAAFKTRKYSILLITAFTLFIATGALNSVGDTMNLRWFTPFELLSPNRRFEGYAILLMAIVAASGVSFLMQKLRTPSMKAAFAAIVVLSMVHPLANYHRLANTLHVISPDAFHKAEQVRSMLPKEGRTAAELSPELRRIFSQELFLREYLSANQIPMIDGDADQAAMFSHWTDNITEYKVFAGEALYQKARANGVRTMAAISRDFQLRLQSAPDYFSRIGTVNGLQIYEVKGDSQLAVAITSKPILVLTSLDHWKEQINKISDCVYAQLLVLIPQESNPVDFNQFDSIVIDNAGHRSSPIPAFYTQHVEMFHTAPMSISLQASYFLQGKPALQRTEQSIDFESKTFPLDGAFQSKYEGTIQVAQSGYYLFELTADEGAQLYIDRKLTLDNGGRHTERTNSAAPFLKSGSHEIVLVYYNLQGPARLRLGSKFLGGDPATAKTVLMEVPQVNEFTDVVALGETKESKIDYQRPDANTIEIHADRNARGILIKESYFPNWKGYFNGHPVEKYLAIPNFMYFPVNGPGTLIVRFECDRLDLFTVLLSLLTFLVLIGWSAAEKIRKARPALKAS